MSDTPLQSTKRELHRVATAPRFWLAIAGAGVLLGIVGPFDTYAQLSLPARLAYWSVTAAATYFVAVGSVALMASAWRRRRVTTLPLLALFGALAGLPVSGVVWAINAAVFPGDLQEPLPLSLAASIVVVTALITVLLATFAHQFAMPTLELAGAAAKDNLAAEPVTTARPPAPKRPKILDRLPAEQRGNLSHMTVQDHYVEVRTERGKAMLLMRLADAIAETEGVEGLQIHRSHWVAAEMVAETVRLGGRLMLRMKDGTLLPVSRSYIDAVRQAGIL